MSVSTELLGALRQAHGYWLDAIGARIATLERAAALAGVDTDDHFQEELRGAREARANAERMCRQMQAHYAERVA